LLDLAFVLLVIFIIATTPMVNDLDLNLPTKSTGQKPPPDKPNFIVVNKDGGIFLNKKPIAATNLYPTLRQMKRENTNTMVVVSAPTLCAIRTWSMFLTLCSGPMSQGSAWPPNFPPPPQPNSN